MFAPEGRDRLRGRRAFNDGMTVSANNPRARHCDERKPRGRAGAKGLGLDRDTETELLPPDRRVGSVEVDIGRDEAALKRATDLAERCEEGRYFEMSSWR